MNPMNHSHAPAIIDGLYTSQQLGNLLPLCKNSAGNRIKIKFSKYYHRGGWTAPRKASWEIRARFLIHARTVAKRTSLWHK